MSLTLSLNRYSLVTHRNQQQLRVGRRVRDKVRRYICRLRRRTETVSEEECKREWEDIRFSDPKAIVNSLDIAAVKPKSEPYKTNLSSSRMLACWIHPFEKRLRLVLLDAAESLTIWM